MQRINQTDFFDLGARMKRLAALEAGEESFDIFVALMDAKTALEKFLGKGSIELRYSKPAALRIIQAIDKCVENHFTYTDSGGERKLHMPDQGTIPSWGISSVSHSVGDFEVNLAAEMRETPTYFVPKRGAYDTVDLVDRAACMVDPSLHEFVGEKALTEFESAGRCFAFGLATAAGFHICRAVEAVLEVYYKRMTGKGKTLNGWHDYIKALEVVAEDKEAVHKPSKKALYHLANLKDSSRNPIMHPRVVLDDLDADILMSEGKNVIMLMAQDLQKVVKAEAKKARTGLGAVTIAGGNVGE